MISHKMRHHVITMVSTAIASWRASGRTDDEIRAETSERLARAVAESSLDAWDQEVCVDVLQRGIEAGLEQEPERRGPHP